MAGFLLEVSGWSERERWVDERSTKLDRNGTGDIAGKKVVLSDRHVRAVLLGAASVDDRCRFSGHDSVLYLRPREIFYVDRVALSKGRRREERRASHE